MRNWKALLLTLLLILLLPLNVLAADVPQVAADQKIYDFAGLLNDKGESQVMSLIEVFMAEYQMDVVILTMDDRSISGVDLHYYSNDFYNSNGFGAKKGGIMLLVNMGSRDVYITAHGRASKIFSNQDIDNLLDHVAVYLSDEAYVTAFSRFTIQSANIIEADKTSRPMIALGGSFALACVIMAVLYFMQKIGQKTPPAAHVYLGSEGFRLTHKADVFLRTHTSRTAIPKNNGSSGGGGRTSSGMRGGSRGGGRKF